MIDPSRLQTKNSIRDSMMIKNIGKKNNLIILLEFLGKNIKISHEII